MYCSNCGKYNSEDSKFCYSCGSKIIRTSVGHKNSNHPQAETSTKHRAEATINASEIKDKNTSRNNEKVNAGLGGWLVLVGLGLIVGLIMQVHGGLEYLPLLSDNYDIPGYLGLLQLEFAATVIFSIFISYLLYLYFKKNKNFPKYYIIFLVSSIVYVILDYLFLASLEIPTQELQQVINDTISENTGEVGRTIIVSTIWVWYMKKSKRVKATFVNEK